MNCVDGLLQYFIALEKDFHLHYVDVMEHCRPETVHQLRLNMKKQLAFFHLLEFLDDSFSRERAMEAYGKLYKKAGRVRDYQVEQSVIQEHESELPPGLEFADWVGEQEATYRERLMQYEAEHSLVPVRRLAHLVKSRIRFLPEQQLKQRFTDYFGHLCNEIRALAQLEKDKEVLLHPLRKRVKELFFNIVMLNGLCTTKRFEVDLIDRLRDLQKLLGEWHDSYFSLQNMQEAPVDCPEKLVALVDQTRAAYVDRIQENLEHIPGLINELETQLTDILNTEPLEITRRSPASGTPGNTHASYQQINVGEGTK